MYIHWPLTKGKATAFRKGLQPPSSSASSSCVLPAPSHPCPLTCALPASLGMLPVHWSDCSLSYPNPSCIFPRDLQRATVSPGDIPVPCCSHLGKCPFPLSSLTFPPCTFNACGILFFFFSSSPVEGVFLFPDGSHPGV